MFIELKHIGRSWVCSKSQTVKFLGLKGGLKQRRYCCLVDVRITTCFMAIVSNFPLRAWDSIALARGPSKQQVDAQCFLGQPQHRSRLGRNAVSQQNYLMHCCNFDFNGGVTDCDSQWRPCRWPLQQMHSSRMDEKVDLPFLPEHRTFAARSTRSSREHRCGNGRHIWLGKNTRRHAESFEVQVRLGKWIGSHLTYYSQICPNIFFRLLTLVEGDRTFNATLKWTENHNLIKQCCEVHPDYMAYFGDLETKLTDAITRLIDHVVYCRKSHCTRPPLLSE